MFGTHRPRARAKRLHRRGLVAVALVTFLLLQPFGSVVQAIQINTLFTPVTQNFNTLVANPTATTVTTAWADDSTLPGWYAQFQSPPTGPTTYRSDSGGTNTGAIYSFGSVGSSDRAFGSIGSGTPDDIFWAVKLENNTGLIINSLAVSYTGEQWRDGGTATTGSVAQTVDFQYQVAAAGAITDADTPTTGWIDFNPLDFTSPTFGATTGTALNGNLAANRTAKSAWFTIPTVGPGQEVWLRWRDIDHPSNDHGLAIDDFSVTAYGAFCTVGSELTDVNGGSDDAGASLVVQPDGKPVMGGYSTSPGGDRDFTLVRYNYDASLDTTFGGGSGIVTTNMSSFGDQIHGIALQADGQIVAAGTAKQDGGTPHGDVALARYGSDGSTNLSLVTGQSDVDGPADEDAFAVAVQPDGKIIVAGSTNINGNPDFLVMRFESFGVLDTTFDTDGILTIDFNTVSPDEAARAVVVQPDGDILVAGYTHNGLNYDFAVARLDTGGSLDPGFAGDGFLVTDFAGRSDQAFGLALQPDGKAVVSGSAVINAGNKDFALARYNTNGDLDLTFDTDGKLTTDMSGGADIARSVVVQGDGKIVAAGQSRAQSNDDFALARYTSAGALDTTFSDDGKALTVFGNADDRAYDVAIAPDAKIVAAGYATNPSSPTDRDFAAARYLPNGSPDAETGGAPLLPPNLVLQKTDSVHTPVVGTDFSYTITVTNTGPGDATNVVITDVLPSQVTFASETHSHGFVIANTTVTNNVGTLRQGETATLNITVTANVAGLISNTADVTSDEPDVNPSDNTDTEFTRIIGVNNLTFSPNPAVGGVDTVTGTVFLSGPAPAGGVTVNLTSNSQAAGVPPSVLVPEGATSATFNVPTNCVQTTTTVNVRATAGTSTFSRRLTLLPCAT